MTMPTLPQRSGPKLLNESVVTGPDSVRIGPQVTSEQRYSRLRAMVVMQIPSLAPFLPERWPSTPPSLDRRATFTALRQATASHNEGLLIIGYGDGSIIDTLRKDTIGRGKLVHVLLLAPEAEAFAHNLGTTDLDLIFKELQLDINFIQRTEDVQLVVSRIFAQHGDIARIAGTLTMDAHPLVPEAESMRESIRPLVQKLLVERYDCLGNDVYDTFLGAKHALMHGDRLIRQPRSSDYVNRYAGKSALCIASGPSISAYYDRIRAIQHEHVIICADSILGGLLEHGIEPDFTCMVERPDNMHRLIDEHAPHCRTVMFALPVVHPSSVIPFGDRVAWWWNADDLYPWLDPRESFLNSGRSTGTMTAALAGLLGIKTAYLIGHDLAFNDGQSHGKGVAQLALENQLNDDDKLSRTTPNYHLRILDVARNGGGLVETMGVWDLFRSDLQIIAASLLGRTEFVNMNIKDGVGAVIDHTVAGDLPSSSGVNLEKSHPVRIPKEGEWETYRDRCLKLAADFQSAKDRYQEFSKILAGWQPLGHSRKEVEAMAARCDLIKLVSPENQAWFAYVFRAALRNLMVRLHHNTFVRTMAERNWNQVQVMRMYSQSIPSLIERFKPELDLALRSFT